MRVLIWICLDTHFRELFRVAQALKSRGDDPVIVFAHRYPNAPADQLRCDAERISYHGAAAPGVSSPAAAAPAAPSRIYRIARSVYRALRRLVALEALVAGAYAYSRYRAERTAANALIDRLRPALIVLPEDNVEYATAALIHAGHQRGVPSVIVPYTLADALEPAEAYHESREHRLDLSRLLHRIIRRHFPRWIFRHRDRELIRLPGESVVGKEWLGLAPPLPWVLNSGAADRIAVESETVRAYYAGRGLPERQLIVTGGLRHDALAARRAGAAQERAALLERLRLPPERRLVLCALPPDQHPASRPGCEFAAYPELLHAWAESLGRCGANVVVNPHPRLDLDSVRFIEQHGVRLVEGDIAALLPLCDVFVASVSATICMALALGIPILNWDVYLFCYQDFTDEPDVRTVESRARFEQVLAGLLAQEPDRERARPNARWGVLDGGAGRRLMALFDELTASSHRHD